MPAEITYTVHSAHKAALPKEVQIEGRTVTVTSSSLIVELIDDEHGHTFRFSPTDAEMDDLVELFQPDATVTATFTAARAATKEV